MIAIVDGFTYQRAKRGFNRQMCSADLQKC